MEWYSTHPPAFKETESSIYHIANTRAPSDRIAELDVPRSGIEPLGDRIRHPHSTDPADNENTIYFIAEHAIRRLLNRIHNSLYGPETESGGQMSLDSGFPLGPAETWQSLGIQKLLALTTELNRQLEEWYTSTPDYLRPRKGTEPLPNDRARVLRLRYYAARHIIHRPFVLQIVSRQQGSQSQSPSSACMRSPAADAYSDSPVVLERCRTCIESCVTYLYNAAEMIAKRSPYLWTFSQSCMACLLVVWMADNTLALRPYVPPMQSLQGLILARLQRWAVRDSTFAAEVRIIEQLEFSDVMER